MILYELCGGDEQHPVYQDVEVSNGNRQFSYLESMVVASLAVQRPFLSSAIIKALNFHAIASLHTNAGEYRPCRVSIQTRLPDGTFQVDHEPPDYYRVQALMDDMVNMVNRSWDGTDAVALAAYVLWRLNWIHPFINGNGRTARAVCYFVLCLKTGGLIAGSPTLPELLKSNRAAYVVALREVDELAKQNQPQILAPVHALLTTLLQQQMASVGALPATPAPPVPSQPIAP